MLTIDDIRKPSNASGFAYVGSASAGVNGHQHIGPRWRGRAGAYKAADGTSRWTFSGPVRRTPEEAAQDYCNYMNGLPELPVTNILRSAGHTREIIQQARNNEKAALYARIKEIQDEERSTSNHPGYVYLIGEEGSDFAFKVGHARTSAQNRMISLQTANPRRLILLGTIVGSPDLEKELHLRYAGDNILQEWFHGSDELFSEFGVSYENWRNGLVESHMYVSH